MKTASEPATSARQKPNSKNHKTPSAIDGRQQKLRRTFKGIRDLHGRATSANKAMTPVKTGKQRSYPVPPAGYQFGAKRWLKRKEVWWEFGLSPRSLWRLDRQRNLLSPRVLMGEYFYDRNELDALIDDARVTSDPEVT